MIASLNFLPVSNLFWNCLNLRAPNLFLVFHLGSACIQVTEAEKGKDRPFLTVEEENTVFQRNYSKTLGTKSYRCHGRGYMAKNPTRSALLKQRQEDAARYEV